jgi:hypothetical protein
VGDWRNLIGGTKRLGIQLVGNTVTPAMRAAFSELRIAGGDG